MNVYIYTSSTCTCTAVHVCCKPVQFQLIPCGTSPALLQSYSLTLGADRKWQCSCRLVWLVGGGTSDTRTPEHSLSIIWHCHLVYTCIVLWGRVVSTATRGCLVYCVVGSGGRISPNTCSVLVVNQHSSEWISGGL